ncbi:MAG: hypothetical protein LUE26_04515 [Alistipes sp.]|nr:hypothetical protein [Alistipes sp.]
MAKKYLIEVVEEPKKGAGCIGVLAIIIAIVWFIVSGKSDNKNNNDGVVNGEAKTEESVKSSNNDIPTQSESTLLNTSTPKPKTEEVSTRVPQPETTQPIYKESESEIIEEATEIIYDSTTTDSQEDGLSKKEQRKLKRESRKEEKRGNRKNE